MSTKASLHVSLMTELTFHVGALVASGRCRSASELLRAALRLLQRDERTQDAVSLLPHHGRWSKAGTSRL